MGLHFPAASPRGLRLRASRPSTGEGCSSQKVILGGKAHLQKGQDWRKVNLAVSRDMDNGVKEASLSVLGKVK